MQTSKFNFGMKALAIFVGLSVPLWELRNGSGDNVTDCMVFLKFIIFCYWTKY